MKSPKKGYAKMCMGKETFIRNQYRKIQDAEEACDAYHQEYEDGLMLVTQLRSCGARKDLYLGRKIHAEISRRDLHKTNVFVGNTLVSMYAKCGAFSKARQVFDELPGQDVISWTALIAGYCQYGCGEEALACFEQMQLEDVCPNAMTFSCVLKACGSIGAIEKGKEVHFEIERSGLLGKDAALVSALVDMYAKCGALSKSQQVFDMFAVRSVVLWTALITGYCQFGYGEQAIVCFDHMEQEGLLPNAMTFACIITACGNTGAAEKGKQVHAKIFGLESVVANTCELGNALVDMYSKCGALTKAQYVFDQLSVQDVVSWTSLISGYCQYGHVEEAFRNFNHMKHEGVAPNAVTFSCILNVCSDFKATGKGRQVHAEMIRIGLLEIDIVLGNALLDMYSKCGTVAKAQQVFDELSHPNLVSWTALITGYCQHGYGKEALICFEKMKTLGLSPDAVTFACILKACGSVGATEKGEEIHAEIVRIGWLEKIRVLGSALVDMYAKCGAFNQAQQVLDELKVQNVISWTALINGYVQHGHGNNALDCFEKMQGKGIRPNALTFASILKACGIIKAADKGKTLHGEIVKKGLLDRDTVLGNALVDMYVKCGDLAKAQQVFDRLFIQNIVSWNVLIAGYCLHGHDLKALDCYERMSKRNYSCDTVTLACILNACGSIRAGEKGLEIHAKIIKLGLLENCKEIGNALVDMYAKCGALAEAQGVFDELAVQDVISWTALIVGYYQQGLGVEALNCFDQMKRKGLSPDAVTFACILKACGSIGALEKGKEIHSEIVLDGFLGEVTVVGSALVEMYAHCGALGKAQEVFDKLPFQNVNSWTALAEGYAQAGRNDIVFNSFNKMLKEGIQPNPATFFVMLNACIGSGLLNEGQMLCETMISHFGSVPTLEHHTCMVHLLARIGQFTQAMELIKKLPTSHYLPVWHAFLRACQSWGNEKLAWLAFKHVAQLPDKKSAPAYVYK